MFKKKNYGIMTLIVGIMFVGAIAFGFTACDFLFGDKNDGNTSSEYGWYGNGSSSSFTISNFTQLEELAKIVRGTTGYDGPAQSDFRGKTVTLTADIDMSGKEWIGIGDVGFGPESPFNGTFDGNNKTISGLNTSSIYDGFFRLIGEDGIVKDLVFVDLSTNNNLLSAASMTYTNKGRIQNISISGSIYIGGSFGSVAFYNYGIVENCNFSGNISGSSGGGIVSENTTSGVVRNCYVTGSITSSGGYGTGGIVGVNSGTVENCYATCNITGGNFIGHNVGGIAGGNINNGIVKNCYATGNIFGTMRIGGVVGDNSGTVQNCYATGNVTGENVIGGIVGGDNGGTVQDCAALNSSITATTGNSISSIYIGRVVSSIYSSSLLNNNYGLNGMTLRASYHNDTVTVTPYANGIHGADVSTVEAATQNWWTTAVNWDFNTVWKWDSVSNLPKLRM